MHRTIFTLLATGLSLALLSPAAALAQSSSDEIIVTATKRQQQNPSGITVTKRGDFLLLEVQIESDAREPSDRLAEIGKTIDAFLTAAKADETIEMSIVEAGTTVRRLTKSNYTQGISFGGRPDTSVARIRVKTSIPDKVENSADLATKLSRFVEKIDETGRISISTNGSTAVSVVDPYQYRNEVVTAVVEEINAITTALGPEYVAIIEGLDRQVVWRRKGDIDLSFSLPYKYEIIPNTLHSVQVYD